MVRSDESAFWGVRRSSGNAGEGRCVRASGVLAAGYCYHCRVGGEGMKCP